MILGDDVFARLLTFPNVIINRPPGFLHTRSLVEYRGNHRREHHKVREQSAARETHRITRFNVALVATADGRSFNISLVVSDSLGINRAFFIESLLCG